MAKRTKDEFNQTQQYIVNQWLEILDKNGEDPENPSDSAEQFLLNVFIEVFKDEEEWGVNRWSELYKVMLADGAIKEPETEN